MIPSLGISATQDNKTYRHHNIGTGIYTHSVDNSGQFLHVFI